MIRIVLKWLATIAVLALLTLGARQVFKPKDAATGVPTSGTATTPTTPTTASNSAATPAPGATPPLATQAAEQPLELSATDVVRASMAELGTALSVTGSVKAVNSAVVKAKVAAELKNLDVREGEWVQAGQLLGQLDATELELRLRQAQEQTAAAQSQLDIANRTLENNRALVEQGFISRTALETSTNTVGGAKANVLAAQAAADIAQKALRDTRVLAPIAGLVSQRFVQAGERVGVDGRIVEIVDLALLELEALVPPEDVVNLRVGQTARVLVDGLTQPLLARVARINPSALPGNRSVMAYLALDPVRDKSLGLRQGLFARASIETSRKRALVVPASVLRYDQAQPYVLVLQAGVAQQRLVQTGVRGAGGVGSGAGGANSEEAQVEVTQGLAEGDLVLRASVGALRAGTKLSLQTGSAASGR